MSIVVLGGRRDWWASPELEAEVVGGGTAKPVMLFDAQNWRFAKAPSPFGQVSETSFTDIVEASTRAGTRAQINSAGNLVTLSSNEFNRTYDPVTLKPLGLLLEDSKQNLLAQSNAINGGAWSRNGATVGASFDYRGWVLQTITQTSANSSHEVFAASGGNRFSATNNTTYAVGFVIQRGTQRYVTVGIGNGAGTRTEVGCTFDFDTNQIVDSGAVSAGSVEGSLVRAYIVEVIDANTYRIGVVANFTNILLGIPFSHHRTTPTFTLAPSFTGNTANYYNIGDITAEQGSFVSSLIRATGSTITRSRDDILTTNVSWVNQTEGTFILVNSFTGLVAAGGQHIINANNGTQTGNINVFKSIGTNTMQAGAAGILSSNSSGVSTGVMYKSGMAYKSGDNSFVFAGAKVASSSFEAAVISLPISQFRVGNRVGNDRPFTGIVQSVLYYPKRLTDYEIQRLTT